MLCLYQQHKVSEAEIAQLRAGIYFVSWIVLLFFMLGKRFVNSLPSDSDWKLEVDALRVNENRLNAE